MDIKTATGIPVELEADLNWEAYFLHGWKTEALAASLSEMILRSDNLTLGGFHPPLLIPQFNQDLDPFGLSPEASEEPQESVLDDMSEQGEQWEVMESR